MAPQVSVVVTTLTVQSSTSPTPPHVDAVPKPWVPIPVAFSIFFGVCLAYTLSYILYRIVMSRRRQTEEDIPDCPDRGVSQFLNGTRLTLNFSHLKSTPLTLDVLPSRLEEEKPLTDPSNPAHSEVPPNSPAGSSSTPFIILTPSFSFQPNEEPSETQLQAREPTEPEPTNTHAQQPLSHRVAAKVKFLSRDRAEAITLDPKLAPVQGPLRPLSMVPSPSRKKRTTLFGLGLKHLRSHGGDPETDSETP